jgi:hypothetical protein
MPTSIVSRHILLRALPVVAAGASLLAARCSDGPVPWPNLADAELQLASALDALHRAPDRFGGHKAEAIRLVRGALEEIELAKAAYR